MVTPQSPDPEKSAEKTAAENSTDENVGDTVPATAESNEVKPMTGKETFLLTITTIALMTALFLVALDTNILGGLPLSSPLFGLFAPRLHNNPVQPSSPEPLSGRLYSSGLHADPP
jgi:hypothetical protein